MKRVVSVILSVALSLTVLFALPVLPNNELPTGSVSIGTEEGGNEGGDGTEGGTQDSEGNGAEVTPQDIGIPDGGPNM